MSRWGTLLSSAALAAAAFSACSRTDMGGTRDAAGADAAVDAGGTPYVLGLAVGATHACAWIAPEGRDEVRCWGRNDYGQLGSGSGGPGAYAAVPAIVKDLPPGWDGVMAAGFLTCVHYPEGRLLCWGMEGGFSGKPIGVRTVADGSIASRPARKISGDSAKCILHLDGTGTCKDAGDGFLLGYEDEDYAAGMTDLSDLAVGHGHVCAIRAGGKVWCWGRNDEGQLGNGKYSPRYDPPPSYDAGPGPYYLMEKVPPFEITGLPPADRLVLDFDSTCAHTLEGWYCWGIRPSWERAGTASDVRAADISARPRLMPEPERSALEFALSVYGWFCALQNDQQVDCWIDERGGAPPATPPRPTRLPIKGARLLGSAWSFACLATVMDVWCFGLLGGDTDAVSPATPRRMHLR